MTEKSTRTPYPFSFFAWTCFSIGMASLVFSFAQHPPSWSMQVAVLIVAAAVTENFALRYRDYSVSLAFPMVVASMVVAGPAAAGLAALASSTNLAEIRQARPLAHFAFNAGQVVLAATAAGWAHLVLRGGATSAQVAELTTSVPVDLGAVLVGGMLYSVINVTLTVFGSWLAFGVAPSAVLSSLVRYAPTQLALVFVGYLAGQAVNLNPWALPLFLFPLLLARQTYQRYEAISQAYVETVRTLVKAIEAKDPYTRGHSQRVAGYSVRIAQEMRLGQKSINELEKAALLHDVGKLALPSRLLLKPGPLSDQEYELVRTHPVRGAEMVVRIPLLRGLASAVRCHHERLDGTGYPDGLSAAAIPLYARILAVADAYDAMTTNRSYRAALPASLAIDELRAGVDLQFDAQAVGAFVACCGESQSAGLVGSPLAETSEAIGHA